MSKDYKKIIYAIIHIICFNLVGPVIEHSIYKIINIFYPFKTSVNYVNKTFLDAVIIAPIVEELVFRKWIFNFFKKKTKYYNLIQSILFGIIHNNVSQKIYTFILGIFLGNIKDDTDNIWICIYLHMLFNVTGLYLGSIYYNFIDIIEKLLKLEKFPIVIIVMVIIFPITGFI